MDLRVNQEIPCSIRERHQKTKEVFALFPLSLSTSLLSLSLSLCVFVSLSRSLFRKRCYSRGFRLLYDLFIVVFFLSFFLSSSPWMFGREDRKLWTAVQSECIFGSHAFFRFLRSVCVPVAWLLFLPPILFWELRLVTGSTPLLSATFVLEVRISGVPRSEGRLEKERREGGRGQGRRGWELNNGWFLIEIRPENRGGERVITCETELNA